MGIKTRRKMLSNSVNICYYFFIAKSQSIGKYVRIRQTQQFQSLVYPIYYIKQLLNHIFTFLRSVNICGSVQSQNVDFRFNEIKSNCVLSTFSHVRLCAILWTVWPARLLCPLGFSRQEYWRELPCPPPGDFPHPGIKPVSLTSPAWQAASLEPPGKCPPHPCLKKQLEQNKNVFPDIFLMNIPKFLNVRR